MSNTKQLSLHTWAVMVFALVIRYVVCLPWRSVVAVIWIANNNALAIS